MRGLAAHAHDAGLEAGYGRLEVRGLAADAHDAGPEAGLM